MPPTGPQGNNYYRSREAILLGLVATFLVLGLTTYFARPEYGTNAWDSLYSTFKTNTTPVEESAYSIRPKCPDHCPSDPYVKPGMIYWGEKKEDTRWVPFPVDEYQPDVIYSNENIDSYDHFDVKGALDHAAPQYMLALQNKDEEVMGWARNKTIVVIGSSHDRNNLEQFCVDVGGAEQNWGGHNGGLCHLKWLNFTISNWFLYGMVDSEEYDWFPATEAPPNTFENRIPHSVEELEKRGFPGGHPDLMIVASLFWDEKFFELYNKLRGVHVPNQKGYLYPEIQWHRNRMQKMFVFLREYFRPDLPIMYRARQVRKNTNGYGLLKIFQLDQSSRAVAKKMGVHEFRWGPNLEGYAEYADNDQHFSEGPSTFLFTDMAFFYLKRAITPGCWQCHSSDD